MEISIKIVKTGMISAVCAALLTGCGTNADSGLEDYTRQEEEIMDEMMDKMDDVEDTGSAALNFLYGMIPHHESAVDMAQSYLKHAEQQAEFKDMAESIVSTQKDEIKQMQDMIRELEKNGSTGEDAVQEELYEDKYEAMMERHHTAHNSTAKDLDTAFAEGMLMHHQMAVEMAEAVLEHTEEETVLELAGNIITAQEQEIARMQEFLENKSGGGHNH